MGSGYSDSECSCGSGSCSCSSTGHDYALPSHQSEESCAIGVEMNSSPYSRRSSTSIHRPDNQSPGYEPQYEPRHHYPNHDSASDSAIDLPKCDSSISTLGEPSNHKLSPRYASPSPHYASPSSHTAADRATSLHTIVDCNASSCTTLTDPQEDSCLLVSHGSTSNLGSVDSIASGPVSSSRDAPSSRQFEASDTLLQNEDCDNTNFSTFSIRPVNGPMRTFQSNISTLADQ